MPLIAWIAVGWMLGLASSALWRSCPGLGWVGLGLCGLIVALLLARRELARRELARRELARREQAGNEVLLVRSSRVACGLVLASWLAGLSTLVEQPSPAPLAGLCRVTLDVEETWHDADGTAQGRVRLVAGERITDQAPLLPGTRLSVAPVALPVGARVEVLAQLRPIIGFRNPSPHPALPQPDAPSGMAWISADGGVRVLRQSWWSASIEAMRSAVRHGLNRSLSRRSAGIARALVLGEGRAVDVEDKAQVRAAGVSHVLAVSGLHVTLVIGALVSCVRWLLLWTPWARRYEVRRIACAIGVPLCLAYAAFAGGSASAWRAAVTSALAWTLVAIGRRPSLPAVCGAAALVLSAWSPSEVWNAGFALSIVATAAIVSDGIDGVIETSHGPGFRVRAALRVTWRAFVATAPIVLWLFEALPWIGLLANLVLVPLSSLLLMPCVMLHALLATLVPPLSTISAPIADAMIDGFLWSCAWLSRAPGVSPPPLTTWQGIALLVLSTLLLFVRHRLRALAMLACVIVVVSSELHVRVVERPRAVLRATFVDVGQGDAALLDMPDGRLMLIDAGGNPRGGPDPGRAVLVPLLRARRRQHIDVMVVTHPHPDHYGGLRAIEASGITIGEVWDSGQSDAETPTGELSLLLSKLAARGTRIVQPAVLCRDTRRFGAASVRVLWPCPHHDPGHDPNDNSLVLRVEHGKRSFLFTGDIEGAAERGLLSSITQAARADTLRADVLKVAHHGSRTSSSQAFIDAVKPSIAVVSAGAFNRYGHPHVDVSARLQRAVSDLLRIDQLGGTIVSSDGAQLSIQTLVAR